MQTKVWLLPGWIRKVPLKRQGFEVGDMILAIDNHPVEGMDGFVNIVSSLKPKEKISVLALDHRRREHSRCFSNDRIKIESQA